MFPDDYSFLFARYDAKRLNRLGETALVPGLLPATGLVLLVAPPKAGKTDLATALAYAVATGTPFAGRPTLPEGLSPIPAAEAAEGAEPLRPALFASYEENTQERVDVLSRLADLDDPDAPPCDLWCASGLPALDTEHGIRALRSFCAANYPRLVVLDSLHGALERTDLARARPARRILRELARLAKEEGTCVLVLHHTNHAGTRPGEHVQLLAAASATILLQETPHPHDPSARLVTLKLAARGLGRRTVSLVSERSLHYRAATDDDLPTELAPFASAAPDPTDERLVALLRDRKATAAALSNRAGLPLGTVRNALRRLRDSGRILVLSAQGNAHVYGVPTPLLNLSPVPDLAQNGENRGQDGQDGQDGGEPRG